MNKPNPGDDPWRAIVLVSAIGVDLVVCLLGGYFLGNYVANATGQPGWMLAGLSGGLVLGVISIVFLIKVYAGGKHG